MREDLIEIGRRFLEHAPSITGPTNPDLAGWNGRGVDICASCAGRILARGCDLRLIADTAVWKPTEINCSFCHEPPRGT